MGTRFGSDDPRFADARSETFLRETLALVTGSGFASATSPCRSSASARGSPAPRRGRDAADTDLSERR
jgi:hypothetical protein